MKFRVMQHNDHDWRKPCEGHCETWQDVEADSAAEAVKKFFITCPSYTLDNELAGVVATTDVKTLAEGVYMLDFGESDDDWFAFRIEAAQDCACEGDEASDDGNPDHLCETEIA